MKTNYLVRPHDFAIFELDDSNGCYRPYWGKEKPNKQQAYKHFSYEILTENYGFFPIDDDEIPTYKKKNDDHWVFIIWQRRSDGHGGCKDGTYEEYLLYKESVKRYNEKYPNWKDEKIK